jgi:methyltransferase (TIGR00027 family)
VTETEPPDAPLLRDISDTARWTAWCRAVESDRVDALFSDPLAKVLAGDVGPAIEATMATRRGATASSISVRTVGFDRLIQGRLREGGIDTVVNLGAGLDTRPYRLELPRHLIWVELDLPDLVAYKEHRLAGQRAACHVERIPLDLAQAEPRRALLASLGARSRGALAITEGLLVYLEASLVEHVARDLAAVPAFRSWLMELLHPALLPHVVQRWTGGEPGPSPMGVAPL